MKPIAATDILDLTRYEQVRDDELARIIALKRHRRVAVGPELTFIFENRDTVRFQIQEMVRTERLVKDAAIQQEVAVYNQLIPGLDELSATLMIEIADRTRIRATLDRLIGIDEHVFLDIDGQAVKASFDARQFESDRISAVQYIRLVLGADLARRFRDESTSVALRVDHPNYRHATAITDAVRRSLIADLDPA